MKQIYVFSICFLVFVLFLTEMSIKKEVDWSEDYSTFKTSPYGTFIVTDLLKKRYKDKFIKWGRTVFEFDSLPENSSYLFINSDLKLALLDQQKLTDYVARGNNAFFFVRQTHFSLSDSLKFKSVVDYQMSDSLDFGLYNPIFDDVEYTYAIKDNVRSYSYFSRFDTLKTEVLGYAETDQANFIRIPHGSGFFYIHLMPLALSNYTLIDPVNYHYAENVLSYLSGDYLILDEYYKGTPAQYGMGNNGHLFRYLLKDEALRWALRISILIALLFLILNSRRKQQIIPIIEPLRNRTLEYAITIGQLHYESKDHKDIAKRLIRYLFEEIRKSYGMKSEVIDSDYYQSLAKKSGCEIAIIRKLFIQIKSINMKKSISTEELHLLNNAMEDFYTNRL